MGEHLNRRFGLPSAATLGALAIGVFFLATIREGHVWGGDFSLYIRHAQNIVRGEPYAQSGYIYNPQNPLVGPKVSPPGFPLLIAPLIGVSGLELRPMKILLITFFVGSLKTPPPSHFTGVMVLTLSRSIEYSPSSVLPVSFMRPWRSSAAGSFF